MGDGSVAYVSELASAEASIQKGASKRRTAPDMRCMNIGGAEDSDFESQRC